MDSYVILAIVEHHTENDDKTSNINVAYSENPSAKSFLRLTWSSQQTLCLCFATITATSSGKGVKSTAPAWMQYVQKRQVMSPMQ